MKITLILALLSLIISIIAINLGWPLIGAMVAIGGLAILFVHNHQL